MNTIPDRIFLQWFGDETNPDPNDNVLVSEVSWNLERVFDADIEYNRANQLPAVQAQLASCNELADTLAARFEEVSNQLAEAVELLRRVANPNQYGDPTPREFAGLRNDARAFLAKVDAP